MVSLRAAGNVNGDSPGNMKWVAGLTHLSGNPIVSSGVGPHPGRIQTPTVGQPPRYQSKAEFTCQDKLV